MPVRILKLLSFRIRGRFAHFRKFYTNSSSLSYYIPPRTAIIGMLGAILQYERDCYYDIFNEDDFRISVAVTSNVNIKKQMQCMNYLHNDSYKLLVKGKGADQHSQCRLELLMTDTLSPIDYTVYIGATNDASLKKLMDIENKLRNDDLGLGVYLGQRQFKAEILHVRMYDHISYLASANHVDTICIQDFAHPDMTLNNDRHIVVDRMPIHFVKNKKIVFYSQ
ncbi:MAG: CRISPR-associated protein Cas5, Hmari subtype [Candidatus Magnetoglobus multicellularis str. Araruama]|uniref:CRISPR-associated protein Cas5, Hmari subtype n=1 Tax=Candidatus Magnetoglobus multicellularis str. Araruama TaxID=890399 RepID=A0A1V1P0R7_9BACT|nr:MAG: CRISPR-associated protein Cas5, Hmari subtype [Candidatus Magnetoglobus multicellularis str. Araruama]